MTVYMGQSFYDIFKKELRKKIPSDPTDRNSPQIIGKIQMVRDILALFNSPSTKQEVKAEIFKTIALLELERNKMDNMNAK